MTLKNTNVTHHFFQTAALYPEKIALESESESISYRQLVEKVNQYIHQFTENGIQSGDKILILHPLSIDLYTSLLALLKINCTLVFVEEWTKINDIINCQNKIKCHFIICSNKINFFKFFIPEIRQLKRISIKEKKAELNNQINIITQEEAIVSFSSGSSGNSKAIIRTHEILNAQFNALKDKIIPCSEAKMISNFPVVILLNLGLGITSYLSNSIKLSKLNKTDFIQLYQEIIQNKITHLSVSPFVLNNLANYIHLKEKINLFQIISGGSPFFPSFVENISNNIHSEHFVVLYGSSEAEPIAHCNAKEIINQKNEKGLYAGEIDEHCQCFIGKIADGELIKNSFNEAGEIFVKGDHVVKKYYNSEEMQAKNKVILNKEIWHRTGDYGYLSAENKLYLTGDLNRKHKNEYLLDIEKNLQEIQGIERATLINGAIYIQVNLISLKNKILIEVKEKFGPKIKINFTTLPLDRRHHGKIKYNELL